MTKITEQPSSYRHLEKMSVEQLTSNINNEDKLVVSAIEKALPQLNTLIETIVSKITTGGRLFYVGAGSGAAYQFWIASNYLLPSAFRTVRSMLFAQAELSTLSKRLRKKRMMQMLDGLCSGIKKSQIKIL